MVIFSWQFYMARLLSFYGNLIGFGRLVIGLALYGFERHSDNAHNKCAYGICNLHTPVPEFVLFVRSTTAVQWTAEKFDSTQVESGAAERGDGRTRRRVGGKQRHSLEWELLCTSTHRNDRQQQIFIQNCILNGKCFAASTNAFYG